MAVVPTETRIRALLSKPNYPIQPDDWKPDTRFDSVGWDSLDYVEAIMAIEDAYEIEVPDAEATKVETFGDLVVLIERINGGQR